VAPERAERQRGAAEPPCPRAARIHDNVGPHTPPRRFHAHDTSRLDDRLVHPATRVQRKAGVARLPQVQREEGVDVDDGLGRAPDGGIERDGVEQREARSRLGGREQFGSQARVVPRRRMLRLEFGQDRGTAERQAARDAEQRRARVVERADVRGRSGAECADDGIGLDEPQDGGVAAGGVVAIRLFLLEPGPRPRWPSARAVAAPAKPAPTMTNATRSGRGAAMVCRLLR
jgi:hypothetical protein